MAVSEALEVSRTAGSMDIDDLGHVNNEVYLHWFMQLAIFHSGIIGWPPERLKAMGQGWVVVSHYIEYLGQVRLGDKVRIKTWVETAEAVKSERRYELMNLAGRSLCRGSTVWAWINYKTGRPMRIPQAVKEGFEKWRYNAQHVKMWEEYLARLG